MSRAYDVLESRELIERVRCDRGQTIAVRLTSVGRTLVATSRPTTTCPFRHRIPRLNGKIEGGGLLGKIRGCETPFPPPLPHQEVRTVDDEVANCFAEIQGATACHFGDNVRPRRTWVRSGLGNIATPFCVSRLASSTLRLLTRPSPKIRTHSVQGLR